MRIAFLLLLMTFLAGCSAVGYAAEMAGGPTKVKAKYAPASRPTAIVIDNYRTRTPTVALRDSLASLLGRELEDHHVGPLIPFHKVYDLRVRDPKAFRNMRLEEIGRAVGAEQVIYVDILESDVSTTEGVQLLKGSFTASIKVIDCKTGETLWPRGFDDGYPFSIDMKYTPPETGSTVDSIQEAIARQAADEIGKLFYTYTTDD